MIMNWIKSDISPDPDTMLLVSVEWRITIWLYTCWKYCSYWSWINPQYYCLIPKLPNE